MNKFKVGDRVGFNDASGKEGIITGIGEGSHPYVVVYGANNIESSSCSEDFLTTIKRKGKRGRPAKPIKAYTWVVLKDSCSNHEDTFTSSEEMALTKLKEKGIGYSLYKLGRAYAKYELTLKLCSTKRKPKKVKKK